MHLVFIGPDCASFSKKEVSSRLIVRGITGLYPRDADQEKDGYPDLFLAQNAGISHPSDFMDWMICFPELNRLNTLFAFTAFDEGELGRYMGYLTGLVENSFTYRGRNPFNSLRWGNAHMSDFAMVGGGGYR